MFSCIKGIDKTIVCLKKKDWIFIIFTRFKFHNNGTRLRKSIESFNNKSQKKLYYLQHQQ